MHDMDVPLLASPSTLDTVDGLIDVVRLRRGDAHALVALQGGQLLSWIPADGHERLFHGRATRYGAGRGIRAGIPVIFPQFSDRGPLPRHGFARTRLWRFEGIVDDDLHGHAVFALDDDAGTHRVWPHRFALRLHVGLRPDALDVALLVHNTDAVPLEFACALHSYLSVDTLAATRLEGLAGRPYRDSVRGIDAVTDASPMPAFGPEIDRIHFGCADERRLSDGAHALRISTTGFTDTVVWNPGETLAATLSDLAPGEHDRFVCVEPSCIEPRVTLAPDARWCGTLTMTACSP